MRTISQKHKRTRALTPCIEANGVDGLFVHLNDRMSIHLFIALFIINKRRITVKISEPHSRYWNVPAIAWLDYQPANRNGAPPIELERVENCLVNVFFFFYFFAHFVRDRNTFETNFVLHTTKLAARPKWRNNFYIQLSAHTHNVYD